MLEFSSQTTCPNGNYRQLKDLPGPKAHSLSGHLNQFQSPKLHQFLRQNAEEFGPIYKLRFAHKTSVVISQPQTVHQILKARPGHFRRTTKLSKVFEELQLNGVFSMEGEQWQRNRSLMNKAMSLSNVKHFQPALNAISQRLVNKLSQIACSDKPSFSCQALMRDYTIDITSALIFGQDINTLEQTQTSLQNDLALMMPMINLRTKALVPYWRLFKTARHRQFARAWERIRSAVDQFIATAKTNLKNADQQPKSLLDSMILAQAQESRYSDDELFGNVMTLLIAGEDTTANALAWALHYLSLTPEVQEKAYEEIQNSGIDLAHLAYEDFDQLPYSCTLVQESMRLMPVTPILYLEPLEPVVIEGYLVPQNTLIIAMMTQAGQDGQLFSTPDHFCPAQWLNQPPEQERAIQKNLMPFGGGARICPGRLLSLTEQKTALVHLLSSFVFTPITQGVEDVFEFTVAPKALELGVTLRTKTAAKNKHNLSTSGKNTADNRSQDQISSSDLTQ